MEPFGALFDMCRHIYFQKELAPKSNKTVKEFLKQIEKLKLALKTVEDDSRSEQDLLNKTR